MACGPEQSQTQNEHSLSISLSSPDSLNLVHTEHTRQARQTWAYDTHAHTRAPKHAHTPLLPVPGTFSAFLIRSGVLSQSLSKSQDSPLLPWRFICFPLLGFITVGQLFGVCVCLRTGGPSCLVSLITSEGFSWLKDKKFLKNDPEEVWLATHIKHKTPEIFVNLKKSFRGN